MMRQHSSMVQGSSASRAANVRFQSIVEHLSISSITFAAWFSSSRVPPGGRCSSRLSMDAEISTRSGISSVRPACRFFSAKFLLRQREREPDITVCEGFPEQGDRKNALHFFCFWFLFPVLLFPCLRLFHDVFAFFHISALCQIPPVLLPEPANPCIIYIDLQPLRKL